MSLKKLIKHVYEKLPAVLASRILSCYKKGAMDKGKGSFVHASVHCLGLSNIQIGQNSCISEGCWLNVNHREGDKKSIIIGNHCFIGKQNFFTSGKKIVIKDYALTTIGCRFIGSSHHIGDPMKPYLTTGTTSEGTIMLGANCFVGAGATVMGNVNVGHGSVIGATSLVLQDVPPFSVVVGNPAKVIKRYSFIQTKWISAREFTQEDESAIINESVYLEKLKQGYPSLNIPWIAAGKSLGDL